MVAACGALVVASACGRGRRGPASDLPASFAPVEWGSGTTTPGAAGAPFEGCASRLRDDRDGTILLLRRSENRREVTQQGNTTVTHYRAIGDYEVLTPGRYAVSPSQWLRVECGTWRPVGPVARA